MIINYRVDASVATTTISKLLFYYLIIYCCYCCGLSNAEQLQQQQNDYLYSYYTTSTNKYGCVFGISILDNNYKGDGSEFTITTNNGTVILDQYLIKRTQDSLPQLEAIIQTNYRPPLVVTYKGKQISQTNQTLGCIATPQITETSTVLKDISLLFAKANQLYDIYIDGERSGTYSIEMGSDGYPLPLSIYIPYTVFSHNIRAVLLPSGVTTTSVLSYTNPQIRSYNCTRGYSRVAKIITVCTFTGDRLYRTSFIGGVRVMDSIVSLTSIVTTFIVGLPFNGSISLDENYYLDQLVPTSTDAYFRPLPKPNQSTFEISENSIIQIQGSYLDAIDLISTVIVNGKKTFPINCTYSYEASQLIGYIETISCVIPKQLQIQDDATLVLVPTFYPNDPIKLINGASASSSPSSFQKSTTIALISDRKSVV